MARFYFVCFFSLHSLSFSLCVSIIYFDFFYSSTEFYALLDFYTGVVKFNFTNLER